MTTPLHALILEDNAVDAELVLHTLRRAGYHTTSHRVDSEEDFLAKLQPPPEIILADFNMPQFSSLRALEILQERQLEIPFIIVSGTIGEERAVEAMQRGATDYIIKDRLGRLGTAVKQALLRTQLQEDKKKAERALLRLATIVETSADAILAKTLEGIITSWNKAAETLYGYTAQEMVGTHISRLSPKGRRKADAPENYEEIMVRLARGERIPAFETVRVLKSGRRIEVLMSISAVHDATGLVTGASAITLDITQRKRAERFLNAEQAVTGILTECNSLEQAGPRILQTVAECLRWEVAVLWTIDWNANLLRRIDIWHATWADPTFIAALSQRTVLEPGMGVAGRTWSSGEAVWEKGALIDAQPGEAAPVTGEGLRGGFGLPMRLGAKMIGVIEFYNPELHEPDLALAAVLDSIGCQISQFCERRSTEAALRASEIRFRHLADAMPQIVWTARADGAVDYLNERYYQFSNGSGLEDPKGVWRSILHPEDRKRTEDLWAHCIRTGTTFDIEVRLLDPKSASARWFLFRAVASTDAAGAVSCWYGTGTDIDEQKRGNEILRISEERFRNLVMALPAAVYTTDRDGLITLFNEHAVELWGRRPQVGSDRWCGSWKLLRLDGTPLPLDECPMAMTLRDGQSAQGRELLLERPDGSRARVLKHPQVLRASTGEIIGAVNMVIDVTEMRQLEGQFRQSQKMEAVGQLAAGVAHDFNNLLTVILGYSDLILDGMPHEDLRREQLAQIRRSAERATTLTRQLLAFGRKQILAPLNLDLNAQLVDLEAMLVRVIGADIELVTRRQPNLFRVKVDPSQFEQIVMNLVINARDAMPTGGKLTIESSNSSLSEMQLRQHTDLPNGPYAVLAVTDSGCGMDSVTKARIFEPFFTTKEVGKGTGLGLATVFGIVKQSGGFIEVDSTVGSGTTFRIYFPQYCEVLGTESAEYPPATIRQGAETILLAEDEGALGELARLYLEASGYKVFRARSGAEAVQICNNLADPIDLLVTDVVMPQMSGRQLAEILLVARPGLKVLYMSGYTDDTIMRHGISEATTNFLAKPFSKAALTQKVREVLDQPMSLGAAPALPASETAW